jgi:hypothetical protein
MPAASTIHFPATTVWEALALFLLVVSGCIVANVVVMRLGSGNFKGIWDANAWVGPIMAIILISAALTLWLCPAPLIFWSSLEFASLGAGAFIGLILAMNAGKDGSSTAGGSPTQTALTNLAVVADWITKTLIGATLVNVKDFAAWIWSASRDSSRTLYGVPDAAPVIIAFGAAFFVIGMLMGLLVVRLHLSSYLQALSPDPSPAAPASPKQGGTGPSNATV